MAIIENGKTNKDNIREIYWVQKQTAAELKKLTGRVEEDKFYSIENETATFKKELVIQYLESIKGFTMNQLLKEKKNTAAWIMAVQIALGYLGYDAGMIDGVFRSVAQKDAGKTSKTAEAVKKFQDDYKLTENSGIPGPETISKLLELLKGEEVVEEDPFKDVKVKEKVALPAENEEVKAEDLLEGLPQDSVTVEFKDGGKIDKNITEEQTVTVVVKVGGKEKEFIIGATIKGEEIILKDKGKKEDAVEGSGEVKVKTGEVAVPKDREVKAEDLVEAPKGTTVELDGEVKETVKQGQTVTVIVKKDGKEVTRVTVIVTISEAGDTMKVETKEDAVEEDPFKDVKVKEKVALPAENEEVKAEDLLEGLPTKNGVTVEFKDGGKIDKNITEEQTVTVVVKVGGKEKEFIIGATIKGEEIILEDKGKKEDAVEGSGEVKVKTGEVAVPKDREVKAEDLVEAPKGTTVELDGEVKNTVKQGQTVTVIVKKDGKEVTRVTVIVTISEAGDTMKVETKEDAVEEDPFKDVKVKEKVALPAENEEVKAEDLLEGLPQDSVTVEFKDGGKIDKNITEEQTVTVVVKVGDKEKEFIIGATIKGEEIILEDKEKKEDAVEEDPYKDVKVKEKVGLPKDRDISAEELLEGLPTKNGVTVEFKDGKGIDKGKDGDQTVTVIVKENGKDIKEFIIGAKIEGDDIILEDKEKKETEKEMEWLKDLNIDDLGSWDIDGNFIFKDDLVKKETGVLEIMDKRIDKVEDGGEGFGYMVKEKSLCVGHFKDGVLDGNGVEFQPYLAPYQILSNGKDVGQTYGIKCCGEWINGEFNNGVKDVNHGNLHIYLDIKDGKADKCYTDGESISFDLEYEEDGLYAINGDKKLKLDKEISAVRIMWILNEYSDKEGEFCVKDSPRDYNVKKLYRKYVENKEDKYEEVMDNIQDSVDSNLDTEAWDLAKWLNEYREIHEKFKLSKFGSFDKDEKFHFNVNVEQKEKGDDRMFIEFRGKRYYEFKDGMNNLGYGSTIDSSGVGYFQMGNFVNGKNHGEAIIAWSDGNNFEGVFKDGKLQGGKFTIVTPENIKGEYEVEVDEVGKRIVSGDNKGKYLNWDNDNKQWKIEDKKSGSEDVDVSDKESLTVDEAKNVVKNANDNGGDLYLGLTSINQEVAVELAKCEGGLYLNALTSIDKEVAVELAKHQGSLHLGLTSIDKEVAIELAKHEGGLYLNALTSIDKEVAIELAKHEGILSLCGLESIDNVVVVELAKHQGNLYLGLTSINQEVAVELAKCEYDLALNGLRSINQEVAAELAKHKGSLSFLGLESIDNVVVAELAKHQGGLHLGLTSIDQGVAVELAKHQGDLYLEYLMSIDQGVAAVELAKHQGSLHLGLRSINQGVAAELAKCEGDLYLNDLTSIDKEVAAELAKCKGKLVLGGLKSMTDDVATELAKLGKESLTIPDKILTENQKKILKRS